MYLFIYVSLVLFLYEDYRKQKYIAPFLVCFDSRNIYLSYKLSVTFYVTKIYITIYERLLFQKLQFYFFKKHNCLSNSIYRVLIRYFGKNK